MGHALRAWARSRRWTQWHKHLYNWITGVCLTSPSPRRINWILSFLWWKLRKWERTGYWDLQCKILQHKFKQWCCSIFFFGRMYNVFSESFLFLGNHGRPWHQNRRQSVAGLDSALCTSSPQTVCRGCGCHGRCRWQSVSGEHGETIAVWVTLRLTLNCTIQELYVFFFNNPNHKLWLQLCVLSPQK